MGHQAQASTGMLQERHWRMKRAYGANVTGGVIG